MVSDQTSIRRFGRCDMHRNRNVAELGGHATEDPPRRQKVGRGNESYHVKRPGVYAKVSGQGLGSLAVIFPSGESISTISRRDGPMGLRDIRH